MSKTVAIDCPNLIKGEGPYHTPPVACRAGYQPEIVDQTIFADSRCIYVEKGLTTENCEETKEAKGVRIGQANPETLAESRVIRNKERL